MRLELLEILRCPKTGQRLLLKDPVYKGDRVHTALLVSEDAQHSYPIRDFIPRFAPESNYAENFGMQWNRFRQTQLDSHSGFPISADRFWESTGWKQEEMAGKWVLDVGCGAGRFAEIASSTGAQVVALDYSNAVDACLKNLSCRPNVNVVQGDIYALPFLKGSFSFVYCLGVLQHTPDVSRAFAALPPMLEVGGALGVDVYQKSWKSIVLPRCYYLLRPFTKHVSKRRLFDALQSLVPKLLPLSRTLGRIPVLGAGLKRLVPVANYDGIYPLSSKQQLEWALLDTFDNLAPEFDQPQAARTVKSWFVGAGLKDIEVFGGGFLIGRARKA